MKFDFDEMKALHQSDPEMFELKRNELINDAISKCSVHNQAHLRTLQHELNEQRRVNPARFLKDVFVDISTNLAKLTCEWVKIKNKGR